MQAQNRKVANKPAVSSCCALSSRPIDFGALGIAIRKADFGLLVALFISTAFLIGLFSCAKVGMIKAEVNN